MILIIQKYNEYLIRIDPTSQEYLNIITEQYYDNLIQENPGIEDALLENLEKMIKENNAQ